MKTQPVTLHSVESTSGDPIPDFVELYSDAWGPMTAALAITERAISCGHSDSPGDGCSQLMLPINLLLQRASDEFDGLQLALEVFAGTPKRKVHKQAPDCKKALLDVNLPLLSALGIAEFADEHGGSITDDSDKSNALIFPIKLLLRQSNRALAQLELVLIAMKHVRPAPAVQA
jgi:hypothetical protein